VQAQDAKVKGMSSELSRLEDRVRSESAQQAELQVSNACLANAGMGAVSPASKHWQQEDWTF
jgi:hypothetical protein